MAASVRAWCAFVLISVVTAVFVPVLWLAVKFDWSAKRTIPIYWHRIACAMLGLRIRVVGKPHNERPLLITANHCSWLDITALGSLMPLCFIAKSEVATWPVIGFLSKLQRTVFVDRKRRTETGKVAGEIAQRLGAGDAMVLFAEGTSSNGNEVLPFRTALIGAAQQFISGDSKREAAEKVWLQPLSIAYTRLQGLPIGRQYRHVAAWYGDMDLVPHLWKVLREGALDVTVTWGDPVAATNDTDRKMLTRQLENQVREKVIEAVFGSPSPVEVVESN
ncbi:MAG: lysophospholipid acyltransferase family protein [Stappiaceae bacterium]